MSVLVDTNVISELVRRAPSAKVVTWFGSLPGVSLSVITVDEIFYGLTLKPNARLRAWFESFMHTHCRVLEITAAIARQAGILRGQLAARGRARTQADMLIAATAAHHGLTLVSRNERDFEGCGVALFNPFR